jgi:hypothetical protein
VSLIRIDAQCNAYTINCVQFKSKLWLAPGFHPEVLPILLDNKKVVDLRGKGWKGEVTGI